MSDARLRELERRWRETGAVDDEVAFLQERLRVGELELRAVEIAAYLEDGASGRLVEVRPFRGLPLGLTEYGRAPCARLLLELAREGVPAWRAERPGGERLFTDAERWVEEPGAETVKPLRYRRARAVMGLEGAPVGVEAQLAHDLAQTLTAMAIDGGERATLGRGLLWEVHYREALKRFEADTRLPALWPRWLNAALRRVVAWALGRAGGGRDVAVCARWTFRRRVCAWGGRASRGGGRRRRRRG